LVQSKPSKVSSMIVFGEYAELVFFGRKVKKTSFFSFSYNTLSQNVEIMAFQINQLT
jgi:hypothetical protein